MKMRRRKADAASAPAGRRRQARSLTVLVIRFARGTVPTICGTKEVQAVLPSLQPEGNSEVGYRPPSESWSGDSSQAHATVSYVGLEPCAVDGSRGPGRQLLGQLSALPITCHQLVRQSPSLSVVVAPFLEVEKGLHSPALATQHIGYQCQ